MRFRHAHLPLHVRVRTASQLFPSLQTQGTKARVCQASRNPSAIEPQEIRVPSSLKEHRVPSSTSLSPEYQLVRSESECLSASRNRVPSCLKEYRVPSSASLSPRYQPVQSESEPVRLKKSSAIVPQEHRVLSSASPSSEHQARLEAKARVCQASRTWAQSNEEPQSIRCRGPRRSFKKHDQVAATLRGSSSRAQEATASEDKPQKSQMPWTGHARYICQAKTMSQVLFITSLS